MDNSIFQEKNIAKAYFKLSIPLVFSMVVTLIYNLADTFFVAQTGDTNIIAGVSLGAPVFTLLMAFGNIFAQGGSSLLSILMGEGRKKEVRRVSSFCFYVLLALGLVIGVIMLVFRTPCVGLILLLTIVFQSFGKSTGSFLLSISRQGVIFVAVLMIASRLIGYKGILVSQAVSDLLSAILAVVLFKVLLQKEFDL